MLRSFVFCLCIFLNIKIFAQEKELSVDKEVQPVAIFSMIFLEKYKSQSFFYAPWGNFEEENATIIEFSVGSGALSRNLIYYGSSPLRIYESKFNTNGEEEKKLIAVEFSFQAVDKKILEYALVLISRKKDKLWQNFPIFFDKKSIPLGSYKITSQSSGKIFLMLGKNKFSLSKGESKIISTINEEGLRKMNLKGLVKMETGYEEIINESISCSPTKRGVLFLAYNGKQSKVSSIIEFNKPIERSHGFNVPPLKIKEE